MAHATFESIPLIKIVDFWSESAQKIFISKINLKHVSGISKFHANRMKFGNLGTKSFLRQFWPILTLLGLKIENFGSKKVLKSLKKLATSLFLYEEFQNPGPEDFADFLSFSREFEFIHNTVPYRTLPFSITIFITLAVS